ncbi:MAG: putative endonuclease [Bacteroidetes bacterium]|nr:MAG: putative endonuclease [Bacteroidota bacterium]
MASVYILYSTSIDTFYIGSCQNLEERIRQHKDKNFETAYTRQVDDWDLFFCINNLEYQQARSIESHIKNMKSRKYLHDLKQYPDMSVKLADRYKNQ